MTEATAKPYSEKRSNGGIANSFFCSVAPVMAGEGGRNFVCGATWEPLCHDLVVGRWYVKPPDTRSVRDSRSTCREGPISPEELNAAVRRFKKALIARAWQRAHASFELPARRHKTRRRDQSSQSHERKHRPDRRRSGGHRGAARSRGWREAMTQIAVVYQDRFVGRRT